MSARIPPEFPWSLRCRRYRSYTGCVINNDRGAGRIGAEEMFLFSSRGPGAPYRYCSYAGCCYDRGAGRIGAEEMGSLGWAGSVVT